MYSDVTSGKLFNVLKDDEDTQDRRTWNSKQSKPTISTKLVSKPASKYTAVSVVDMILLEESSWDKHSRKGTVTAKTLITDDLSSRINGTLFISKQKKARQVTRCANFLRMKWKRHWKKTFFNRTRWNLIKTFQRKQFAWGNFIYCPSAHSPFRMLDGFIQVLLHFHSCNYPQKKQILKWH